MIGWVGLLVAGVAAGIAGWQVRESRRAVMVQRAIDAHRDLTTGDVGSARDRLTTLMWKYGERQSGTNRCHRPAWSELLADPLDPLGPDRGVVGQYPDEVVGASAAEPMRDLYALLWCFERIEGGRQGGAIDEDMLQQLIGPHAVWWDELCRDLTPDNTLHVNSLRALARELETAELRQWARSDFI